MYPHRDSLVCRPARSRGARSLLLLVTAASVGLVGCNAEPEIVKPTAAVAPSASAVPKQLSKRKLAVEQQLTDMLTAKGVSVKSVACPDDAEDHYLIKCPIETVQGDHMKAECRGDNDHPTCRLDTAIVDPKKVAGQVRHALPKKKRGKADVTCPDGPIVKAVGERFYCKVTQKKKTFPVDVTVTDLDGQVKVAFKS